MAISHHSSIVQSPSFLRCMHSLQGSLSFPSPLSSAYFTTFIHAMQILSSSSYRSSLQVQHIAYHTYYADLIQSSSHHSYRSMCVSKSNILVHAARELIFSLTRCCWWTFLWRTSTSVAAWFSLSQQKAALSIFNMEHSQMTVSADSFQYSRTGRGFKRRRDM